MKAVIALCLLALFAGAFAAQLSDSSYRTLWDAWRRQHKKSYADHEHNYRFGVWRRNLDAVLEHNAAGHSYELGMNHLADLSNAEYRALMLATHVPQLPRAEAHVPTSSLQDLPASFDWRTKNAVTPVKDQGQCGSCWTFSTTGAVEGAWAIAKGSLVSLSEQNLVDCSHECDPQNPKDCNNGCNGGLMEQAYQYIINNKGIDTEACYPYKGVDGTCSYKTSCVGATISSYKAVASGDEAGLADAIANHGPVAVAIDASAFSFQLYSGGVYHPKSCKTAMDELDHGVLVVGYSSSDKGKYWIVKNSWGPKWGLSGYIWMAKDSGNVCGIATYASYPVV